MGAVRRRSRLILALPCFVGWFWACTLDRIGRAPLGGDSGGGGQTPASVGGALPSGGGGSGATGGGGDGGDGGGGGSATTCDAGEFVTGVVDGQFDCSPISGTALSAMNAHCSIYLGWNDVCSGCTDPPAKWGRASANSCENGAGLDNDCITASLDGENVQLFGLNTDGGVNFDDQFHAGLRCATPDDPPLTDPCPPGTFVTAVSANGVECTTAERLVVSYVQQNCNLYFGWRNVCDDCTDPPDQWGYTSPAACVSGNGGQNTCTTPDLNSIFPNLFGFSPEGNVDDNDKFYVGLYCAGASVVETKVDRACPAGALVVGIDDDGGILCASPLPAVESALRSDCHVYFGWLDSCDDCDDPPDKWGRVSHNGCLNGNGDDNTCTMPLLNGITPRLFGLNTDNDVNDDDKFYVGMKCF